MAHSPTSPLTLSRMDGPFSDFQIATFIALELDIPVLEAQQYIPRNKNVPMGYSPQRWFGVRAAMRGCPTSPLWRRRNRNVPLLPPRPIPETIRSSEWKPLSEIGMFTAQQLLALGYNHDIKITVLNSVDDWIPLIQSLCSQRQLGMRDLLFRGEETNGTVIHQIRNTFHHTGFELS